MDKKLVYGAAKAKEAEIKALAEKGLRDPEIAVQTGLSTEQVRYVRRHLLGIQKAAGRPKGMTEKTVELIKQIRQLASAGLTGVQIAKKLGMTRQYINSLCRRAGVHIPTRFKYDDTATLHKIRAAAESNRTVKQVAEATGLHVNTVYLYNKRYSLGIEHSSVYAHEEVQRRLGIVRHHLREGRTRNEICQALGWPANSPRLIMFAKKHGLKLPYTSERYRKVGEKIRVTVTGRVSPIKGTKRTPWKSQ